MEAVRLRKARTVAANRLAVREYREGLACTGCGRRGTETRLMLFGGRNVSDAVDRGLCLETVMGLARASTPYCAGCRTAG